MCPRLRQLSRSVLVYALIHKFSSDTAWPGVVLPEHDGHRPRAGSPCRVLRARGRLLHLVEPLFGLDPQRGGHLPRRQHEQPELDPAGQPDGQRYLVRFAVYRHPACQRLVHLRRRPVKPLRQGEDTTALRVAADHQHLQQLAHGEVARRVGAPPMMIMAAEA